MTAAIGLWGSLVGATGLILNASAAATDPVLSFDIPAQPLAGALKEFAAQAHVQLLYQTSTIENLRSNPLRGNWDRRAALEELLRNTDLEVVYSSDNAATIRPVQVSSAARGGGATLKPDANAGDSRSNSSLRTKLRGLFTECDAAGNTACSAATAAEARGVAANIQLAEVVVTGSRVITNGNDSPTPVTVVSVQDLLTAKPATVFENLVELPQFSGSLGAAGMPSMTGPTSGYVQALNLRNLGALRSLVLFDGRRVPPTTADGYVSVNMLPQMLIQRVEVVTGGASAVYGSDAVTGVVNFIVDKKFDGLKVNLQRGVSRHNDDASYQLGLAVGTNLFERGRFIGSYERYRNAGIPHRVGSGRTWLDPLWTLQGNGTAGNPYHLQDNVRIANATFGGLIVCPSNGFVQSACPGTPLVGHTFDDNGLLTPFEAGSRTGLTQGTIQIGGDGAYQNWPSLKAENKLDQLFVRFDYELGEQLQAYVAASGALQYSASNPTNLRTFGQGIILGACNAFLAGQYQQAYGCANPTAQQTNADQPTIRLSKVFDGFAPGNPGSHYDSYARSYFAIAGMSGSFGGGYRWDAAYTRSQAGMKARANKLHNQPNLYAAIDAVVNPADGQIVCNVTLTHPGRYPGCVPLNPFGPTAASAAAINYAFGRIEHEAINALESVSGSLTGAPFASWPGPVDMALSAELRRQTYEFTTNAASADTINCVGLRFGNCTPGVTNRWANVYAIRTPVEQRAAEAAVEFNAPLLRAKPAFTELDLNAAVRFTRYDNDPGADSDLAARSIHAATWKTGITWDIVDSLTLRWTRSRDMRAPNLFDLYEPVSTTGGTRTTDYLLPGTPVFNAVAVRGGNSDLKPEVSHTSTLGAVWRPTPEFSISMDGYDITVKDALASINGASQPVQLACYASGGASPLCSLQERPLGFNNATIANAIAKTYMQRINIAEQRTWGIDFETNWQSELLGRRFSLRALLTYQPHLLYSQPPLATHDQAGAATNDVYGLLPAPVWKALLFVHYNFTDNFALDITERWRSSLQWSADPAQYGVGAVPSVAYTNMTLAYDIPKLPGALRVFLNIQNLFDKDPPPSGSPGQQIQPGLTSNGFAFGDDVVGRYYTLGLRLRL